MSVTPPNKRVLRWLVPDLLLDLLLEPRAIDLYAQ